MRCLMILTMIIVLGPIALKVGLLLIFFIAGGVSACIGP